MAAQTQKSALMAKYGSRLNESVQSHANDETNFGFVNLPPGINGGIAQLERAYFDVYKSGQNKGEYYFRASGTVHSPDTVTTRDGTFPVKGLQTSIMIPVCETRTKAGKVTSQDDNVKKILEEMRKLAGQEFTEGATGADLEDLAAQLEELSPFFRFSTWQSEPTPEFPNPKVWENWHGSKGLEDYQPEASGDLIENTPRTPAAAPAPSPATSTNGAGKNGSFGKPPTTTTTPRTEKAPPKAKQPEPEPEKSGGNFSEFDDIDSLLVRAKDEDLDARSRLAALAVANGHSEEDVDEAPSWEAVADMARGDEGPAPAAGTPKVGEVYHYKPVNPKTGTPMARAVEVEVTKVFERASTVTCKNMTNGKVYTDVPFGQLIRDE